MDIENWTHLFMPPVKNVVDMYIKCTLIKVLTLYSVQYTIHLSHVENL